MDNCLVLLNLFVFVIVSQATTYPDLDQVQQESVVNGQTYFPPIYPADGPALYRSPPPPLGHSRPFFYAKNQQETAFSQRPQLGYHQQQLAYDSPRFSGYKDSSTSFAREAANDESLGLLGSGNFGVIRGGTFYGNEATGTNEDPENYDDLDAYFRNGHGRPFFYYGQATRPRGYRQPQQQQQQFANFRDFADINVPTNSAYSQYVVVYVNRNGTTSSTNHLEAGDRPKNIIEHLALLDSEDEEDEKNKKVSKSKRKLAKILPEKKHTFRLAQKALRTDLHEPLLALS